MRDLAKTLEIQPTKTTSHRPSANGMIERVHATLHAMFAKTVEDSQRDWPEVVPFISYAYNTAYHSSTTFSPFYLMFMRQPKTPVELTIGEPTAAAVRTEIEFVEETAAQMRSAHALVREHMRNGFDKAKKHYDSRVKSSRFTEGQLIWYFLPKIIKGRNRKWELGNKGPYRIVRRINEVNYVIQRTPRTQPLIAHIDQLTAYTGETPACWVTGQDGAGGAASGSLVAPAAHEETMPSEPLTSGASGEERGSTSAGRPCGRKRAAPRDRRRDRSPPGRQKLAGHLDQSQTGLQYSDDVVSSKVSSPAALPQPGCQAGPDRPAGPRIPATDSGEAPPTSATSAGEVKGRWPEGRTTTRLRRPPLWQSEFVCGQLRSRPVMEASDGRIRCVLCDATFGDERSLRRHYVVAHRMGYERHRGPYHLDKDQYEMKLASVRRAQWGPRRRRRERERWLQEDRRREEAGDPGSSCPAGALSAVVLRDVGGTYVRLASNRTMKTRRRRGKTSVTLATSVTVRTCTLWSVT